MATPITPSLVGIAVILRDYIDVAADASYASKTHERLVDIADTLYHNGMAMAKHLSTEYLPLYVEKGEQFWIDVLRDINAIDSQVSSHNVHDLLDDYRAELLKVTA